MGFFDKIKAGLKKTRENISSQIHSMLHAFTKIDEELFEELEELLVMADVGVNTAERICDTLRARVKERGITDPNEIMGLLEEVVTEMIDGDNAAEVRDALKAAPEWADIKAVKNNQIYCIPKGCFWWGRLCGDTPLQALWAASILHPDEVSFDIKEETKKYYRDFKQCELTDEEVDRLLRTELLPE